MPIVYVFLWSCLRVVGIGDTLCELQRGGCRGSARVKFTASSTAFVAICLRRPPIAFSFFRRAPSRVYPNIVQPYVHTYASTRLCGVIIKESIKFITRATSHLTRRQETSRSIDVSCRQNPDRIKSSGGRGMIICAPITKKNILPCETTSQLSARVVRPTRTAIRPRQRRCRSNCTRCSRARARSILGTQQALEKVL